MGPIILSSIARCSQELLISGFVSIETVESVSYIIDVLPFLFMHS